MHSVMKNKCIRDVLAGVLCLVMILAAVLSMNVPVQAAEETVTVPLPYTHVYYTNDTSADDAFMYQMVPEDPSYPLPEGSSDGRYVWTIYGMAVSSPDMRETMTDGTYRYTTSGTLDMQIPAKDGEYRYYVTAYVPETQTGYTYDPHTYEVIFRVVTVSNGTHTFRDLIITDQDGNKHPQLDLDPQYKSSNTKVTPAKTKPSKPAKVTPIGQALHKIAPKTGDIGNVMLYAIVILVATLILIAVLVERRKRRDQAET